MAEWALQHPWMTFILLLIALRVAWVWGQAVRKRERIVRIEPPPPLRSTVKVEQVCPRCRSRESAVDDVLDRIDAGVKVRGN